MNGKERILAALNNQQPDRVPIFELYINESSIVELAQILIPQIANVESAKTMPGDESDKIRNLYCAIVDVLDLDSTTTYFSTGMKVIGDNLCQDKYGTVYHLSEHGDPLPVKGSINSASDLKGFDMASKVVPEDFEGVRYVVEKVGSEKAHFLGIYDPFKVTWQQRGGMENLLCDYILNPQMVHDLSRIATDFNVAVIDMACKAGIDAVAMSGDIAGETSLLMSPDHYREFIKPYQKEIIDYAHQQNLKIVKHSDGDIWPILDDFIDIGFDAIHPFQPQCMDIAEAKKHLAGKTCIIGNIDCRNLLVYATVEEVERVTRETIKKTAQGGGYIISSSNSIHPGCKPQNYIAMVDAVHKYGAYNS